MLLRIVYLITLMIVSLPSLSLEVKAKDSLVERYLDLSNQGEELYKVASRITDKLQLLKPASSS